MQTSIFLARLVGPILLLAGIGVLANRSSYRLVGEDVLKNRALLYIGGIIGFTAGLALVLVHNVWALDWRLILTLLGWLLVLRGALVVAAPETTLSLTRKVLALDNLLIVNGAVVVLLGLLLCYFGYFS
jgi:hypothetical protein